MITNVLIKTNSNHGQKREKLFQKFGGISVTRADENIRFFWDRKVLRKQFENQPFFPETHAIFKQDLCCTKDVTDESLKSVHISRIPSFATFKKRVKAVIDTGWKGQGSSLNLAHNVFFSNAAKPTQRVLHRLKSNHRPHWGQETSELLNYCLPQFHDRLHPCVHGGGGFFGTGCMYCAHTEHCWSLVLDDRGKRALALRVKYLPRGPLLD